MLNLLPFGELPPFRQRRFVPANIDLGDWGCVEPLFDELERRVGACRTGAELEGWLLDWGELSAALDEESARRHIAMTCHTDNAEAERAYLHYVENLEPKLKPRHFTLDRLYLGHPARGQLAPDRYAVFDRNTAVSVELFREENVPLETEEAKLGQQYQKLSGALTVEFRGEERTLIQMGRFAEEPDRATREEAWRRVAERRLQERERFEELFDRLADLRNRIARNAGFDNYRDFAFRKLCRFDYGPEDCVRFHEAVEAEVMPLVRRLQSDRRRDLGVEPLRPWDLAVDPKSRPPLRPFEQVERMVAGAQEMFDGLDPALGEQFTRMRELRLLDLDNRKGKAPGGYLQPLNESRLAFIFMNAVGLQRDVETILHEGGHAFHTFATQSEELYAYRHAPIEFCEVASMSMELLGGDFLGAFYSEDDLRRARRTHLEGVVTALAWIATVDAFQHWLYTHPGHSPDERRAAWLGLMERFGGDVDWSGLEEPRGYSWHRQLHIFLYPFYYIEYGIAQLGALSVWANYRRDPVRALADYRAALALGGSRPLPELFARAGCRFEFGRETIRPLVELLERELEQCG